MAAPNAPLPLRNQVKVSTNVVVTVVLRNLGSQPGFADNGGVYNVGDPTATYTITMAGVQPYQNARVYELFDILDDLTQDGLVTVS
jgi:hypothetical protein